MSIQNMRIHFVESYHGVASRVCGKTPLVMMLKNDVAIFFGFASWTQFLARNYTNTTHKVKKKGAPPVWLKYTTSWYS